MGIVFELHCSPTSPHWIPVDVTIGMNYTNTAVGGAHYSAQIIATSHDLSPQRLAQEGNPLISGKSRLVKDYNLARMIGGEFEGVCQNASV